jgi:ketosteroid isomerase-like protein
MIRAISLRHRRDQIQSRSNLFAREGIALDFEFEPSHLAATNLKFRRIPMQIARRLILLHASATFLGVAIGCAQPAEQKPAPPDLATIEANIRKMDKDWSAAAGLKDLDKATQYYADDAQLFGVGAPAATGKDAVRKVWNNLLTSPDYEVLSFAPAAVNVAAAGDMAYETGTYELVMKDKKGKPVSQKGVYVVVWKKQAEGSWKVEVDSASPGA